MAEPARFSMNFPYLHSQPMQPYQRVILAKDDEKFLATTEADLLSPSSLNRVVMGREADYRASVRELMGKLRERAQELTMNGCSDIRSQLEGVVARFQSSCNKFYVGNDVYENRQAQEIAANGALTSELDAPSPFRSYAPPPSSVDPSLKRQLAPHLTGINLVATVADAAATKVIETGKFVVRTYSALSQGESSPASGYLKFQLATHIASTHVAATVVETATTAVAETAKVVFCSHPLYPEEAKQNCKSTLNLAVRAGKVVAETLRIKEPIKKTIEFVNSIDGASMTATLETAGVDKKTAKELGTTYMTNLKTGIGAAPIPIVKPIVTVAKLGIRGTQYTACLAGRAIQPLIKQPLVSRLSHSIAQNTAIAARMIQESLHSPMPLYAYALAKESLAPLRLHENRFAFRENGAISFSMEGGVAREKLNGVFSSGRDSQDHIRRQIRDLKKLREVSVPRSKREMTRYHEMIGYRKAGKEGKGSHEKMIKEGYPMETMFSNAESPLYIAMWKRFQGSLDRFIAELESLLEPVEIPTTRPIQQQPLWHFPESVAEAVPEKSPFARGEANQVTKDMYSWINDCPSENPISHAVVQLEREGVFSEIIPSFDHVNLPKEKLVAKLIDENACVKNIENLDNHFIRYELDTGNPYLYLEGEAEAIYNRCLGHTLFAEEASPFFKTAKPVAVGRIEASAFLVTAEIPGETMGYLASQVGSMVSSPQRKEIFTKLFQGSGISGRGVGHRQSIHVDNPIIARSGFDLPVFQNHIARTNELLRRANLPHIQLESQVQKVSDMNRKPIQRTHGVGTHISLHQLVVSPDKTIGLLDVGLIPSYVNVAKTPLHCPAQELYAFFHAFDKGLLEGLTVEETLKLKSAFKKGYFAEAKIEIPQSVQNYYDLYYSIDTISELAAALIGGKAGIHADRLRHELTSLIDQLNIQRFV